MWIISATLAELPVSEAKRTLRGVDWSTVPEFYIFKYIASFSLVNPPVSFPEGNACFLYFMTLLSFLHLPLLPSPLYFFLLQLNEA